MSTIHDTDYDTAYNVQTSHYGDQLLTYLGDRLNAAQDNQTCDNHQNDTCCDFRNAECTVHGFCDGVCLCHITDTEASDTCKDCEQDTQPFMTQTSFQSVHGTTDERAIFCFYTVFNCQSCFTEFCCHTQQTCEPHPEYSTGATNTDCSCNTYDITGTDSSCKSCCQSSEAADITGCFLIRCYRQFYACEGFPLNPFCSDC